MKDFNFLMKNTNVESAVWNDGGTTVERQSNDSQSQRQYSVGITTNSRDDLELTTTYPLPDSVSNPCRVRVLDYPQGISGLSFARLWKYAAMLVMVLCLGVGEMWGAESDTNNPATVSYGTGGAAKTFLDVANTVSNCTISSGSVACVTYGLYEMDKNWKPAFYSGPANGSSSSYNYSGAASVGFMAGSSAGTGTAANKSATSGYGAAKYTSSASAVIYVTGVTGIAVMGKDNNTKDEKRLHITVEEYAADGTCTAVGTTKSSYSTSLHITTFDAGSLSGTKYYKVTLTSGNTSNCETSQIRFTKYIAAGTTHSVSAVTNTGTDTYGTVSAAASTVAEGGTTTITATPASGYRVTNWVVSGTGASISPSGASNSNTTTLTMGTANATVTVTFGAIPSHTISYTNTKGMDNSANPTSYYEGVGVASFTKLRHAVGYDFTGWSPSSISSSATTNQTIDAQWTARAAAAGTGTLTYALAFGSSTITTSSITRNNGALYDATDVSVAHTSFDDGSTKNGCSGKLHTTSSKDGSNYVELTFKIADGYTFTPTEVSVKANAVSTDKTLEVELKDNAATPNSKSVTGALAQGSTSGGATVTLDFDASGEVALEGTVTVKIFVYGATDAWRLGTSVIITGTVTPPCTPPTASWSIAPADGTAGGNMNASLTTNYATGVVYSSSNTDVATVSGNGTTTCAITYVAAGTARITATVTGDGSTICTGPATCYTDITVTSAGSGWGIAGDMNSWTAASNEMTGSGTVSTTISLSANTQYGFKVVDMNTSTWHTNTGTIKGGITNWDFSTTGGSDNDCYIRTSCAGDYTFTYNTSTNELSVTYPNSHKVYFDKDGASWSNIYAYGYNDGTWNIGWPGIEITSNTEDNCGTEYYAYTNGYTYIIFNNGSGGAGNQTGDITVAGYEGKHAVGASATGWEAYPTYTVTYNGNGNTGGSVPTDASSPYACSSTVTILGNTGSLVRSGYTFNGWNTDSGGGGTSYTAGNTFTISANTTLYAQWEAIKYTVTYNVNGGGSVTPTSATQASGGASITLPTPTWSGYTFDGWYNAGTKVGNAGASYTPTANITLYAHWTDNISGKVFSFIDNNYGDKFKAFDLSGWVTANGSNKDKTYTNGTTGVQFVIDDGYWDSKSNAISALAKFKGGTSNMSIVIPTGKIATVKISYNAYGTGNDYRLTINGSAQANPSTKLDDSNTNAEVISNMKEITLNNQTGTLTLGISNTGKNNYIGRVSAVITGYTISYAAGTYGSGSLASGTKTHGSNFTLSSTDDAFTRDGYVYDGWSTNADGSTKDYNLGGTYSTDAVITLYPHWVESCSATQPGAISKSLSSCTLTLTASGSPASNNTWYWQSAADGTATNLGTGATKTVTTTGTWYIRSYCSTGSGCWSDAQSVTVSASDLTPAAPTGLSAGSISVTGATFTITDAANASSYDIYYSTSSTAPTLGTGATTTSTSKTKAVTGLMAGTTYYAWVRSVCGSYKSGWTALGNGGTFITSTVTVTHTLSNVTKTSGATTAGGSDYTAVYSADTDYSMPTPSVTIGGNSATSGTDYTWNAGAGTITIPANKITGNIVITLSSAAVAPTNVAISGTYHYYPGETITLTATATGGNGPKTYQWYHGGTADGNAIDGATSATFTKSNCVVGDAGDYYCKVTCGGSASRWSDGATEYTPFKVKIMQFVLKNNSSEEISRTALTKVDATHATIILHLTGGTTYKFCITDGCGNYFGNTGTMTNGNSTDWYMNADADCGMTTGLKTANYTFNVTLGDLGNGMQVTAIYPGGDQAAGKIIYWDNSVLNWADGAQWYRIGKSTHHNKIQMTKVSGTANLYKVTTIAYNGFEYWHIANNQGNGDGNLFWTKGDAAKAITNAMDFEGAPVTLDVVTVTPTTSHATGETSDNDNCQFYTHTTVSGMKTDNVAITAPSNGTITVVYDDVAGDEQSFTSGNRDLAHTVILKSVTAAPATGYDLSSLTINGNTHTSGNSYTCSGATTIAASFSLHNYNVTYSNPGNGNNYTIKVASGSASSESKTANMDQTITLVATPAAGYDFTGWTISKAGGGTVSPADPSATTTTFTMPTDNVTITASFTLKTYTVTYNAGSGAGISGSHANDTKTYGVNLTLPGVTFTRTGYTQTGWATSDGGSQAYALSGSYTDNAAANLYPVWTAATYTVTLNTNGGTINAGNVTSYNYGTGATLPTNVTKTGYTFDGWFNNSGLTGDAVTTISSSATGNKEFWAKWTCVTPTFETNLSTSTVNYNVGAAASALTVAATAGGGTVTYQWYSNDENNTTTPTTLTGQTSASYTPSTAAAGTTYYYCVATNSTAGCSTTATSNITPVTVAATYTVTYQYNGATSGAIPASETAASVTLPEPTRTSYVLDGWYKTDGTKVGDGGDTYNPTADVTLYARWETNCAGGSSTATFNFNSGNSTGLTIENSQASWSYNIVNSTTNNIPVLDSYFLALSFTSTSTGTIIVTTNDSYASIDSIKFNSASTDNSNPKVAIFTVAGSPETETSRLSAIAVSSGTTKTWRATPYKLDLSATKPTGKVRFKFTTGSSGRYAGFDNIQIFYGAGSGTCYSVKYCGNGAESGYVSDPTSYAANDDPVVLGNVGLYPFVRSGYTLTGWNTEAGGGGTAYAAGATITDISSDVTLYAQWTPTVNYSVTHSLTNVTATSGATGASAAIGYTAYNAVFEAAVGYDLPSTITVTIGGSPATVSTDYTWNSSTGALEILAASVTGDIVVTIVGPEHVTSDCITITHWGTSNATTEAWAGSIAAENKYRLSHSGGSTSNNKSTDSNASILLYYGTTMSIYDSPTETTDFENVTSVSFKVKLYSASKKPTITVSVGSGAGETVTLTENSDNSTFQTYTVNFATQQTGAVKLRNNGSGDSGYKVYIDDVQICTASMSACTTPIIPSLSNQALCEGANAAAWDATVTNAAAISAAGETVSYQWQLKNGSNWDDISGATSASYDVSDAVTEAMAGTYRVVVTVSKAGYSSSSATREVTLSVTEATEVTGITADKATVYPGNSVTLTATANTSVTWQWYTCTNAEGAGESSISGATSAAYTIASAPAVGTYYYKVKATSSCGTASAVYTLTVSPAASSEDCFHFVSVIPASDFNASSGASLVTPTHATTLEGGTMKVGSQQVTFTKDYGLKMESSKTVSITLESALEAGNVVIVKGTSGSKGYGITINGVNFYDADNKTFDVSYTVLADDGLEGQTALTVSKYSGSSYLQEVKITGCGASCTDPEVTASADNTTACVGSSVTFTAANAHASAKYQWQKLDGTWTNISGATESTYTITSVVAGDAGKYRVIASNDCNRTSNEVTLSVPSVPDFGSTVPSSVSVMQTIALSINTVEATDAVKYRWYKSADPTWDAGDVEIGTNKELIKAYDSEAIGSPSYYIFCRAQNACGITTSSAIAVNVTAYVEEDCATRGNEGEAQFGFENTGCSQGTYSETAVWTTNSRSKYLTYTAPDGKYFKTAKLTVAVTSGSKCGYAYSTDGGTTWTYAELTSLSSTLTEKTINLRDLGGGVIDAFRISRNLQDGGGTDHGVTSGNFHLSKACFEYTDACTVTTVTPSTESTSYEMGGVWSNPTFTLAPAAVSGETLTYTSSNEDIASVDDEGTVTFNGDAGTVTITASYAGGTVAAVDYCASSGSYTITVSCTGGAPKVVADGSTDMSGCISLVILHAKQQDGTSDFADGTYQWFRNGEEIDGATGSSYTATQAGTYTVERTNGTGCTTPSTNSAIVTSETTEPEVERLVPFQYYHVDKDYSDQMKMRHLFAVKNSGKLDGKSFKMYVSRNGGEAADVTSSNALVVWPNADGHVDTVMVDLNKLSGKYSENDELVYTCKAIDCSGNVSDVYKETITMNVIGATPTLALICSGSSKAGGTRKTGELTVGGDFLTGYNKADLCEQTGNTSFNADAEWGLYTRLKANYLVTPVNGYAVFNKLNYEPFDILLLTDYPKASKSDAAATVLDDMADLVDFRPMLSLKAHMVSKTPSKWAEKGFTTAPVHVTSGDGRIYMDIVCYAHPMFDGIKEAGDHIFRDHDDNSEIVYEVLTEPGYENSKGLQGFEIDAAENFVTIGLIHTNATATENSPSTGELSWTPALKDGKSLDRMLVAAVERQTNLEARLIVLAVNCGAQTKFTETGRTIVHRCLSYLLTDATITPVADCSFTFDNGAGYDDYDETAYHEAGLTGTLGDGKWSTAANWGPDRVAVPGPFTSVRIAAPATVNMEHAHAMSVQIVEGGSIDIPAGNGLEVKSTIRRSDGSEISPTEINDIHIGSTDSGNGTLIFNNNSGDSKARVDMYSKGFIDGGGVKNYQYMGVPCVDINALYNYYGSWIYSWSDKGGSYGWKKVVNGGIVTTWTGYCITQESPVTHAISGTLAATGTVDIDVPAGENMVVGNSWTAPIDINALTTDDLEGLTANIYFFNTGVDKTGSAGAAGSRYAGSTYVTVPVEAARYDGEDDHINSLQGFFVKNPNGSAGTLHLDYDRHVRGTTRGSIIGDALHAPKRAQATDTDEPVVLKIRVSGRNYDDRLLLLEREDFSMGFDNGWDGDKWDGNESALYIYTKDNEGTENSVSAVPELEGTVIGFRAGEDEAYTLIFEYLNSDEELYLFDTETTMYTQIRTGVIYRFFTNDKEKHERFIITRKSPQVATGVENTEYRVQNTEPRKLIIEDKMYILVNGMLYDATGKIVK